MHIHYIVHETLVTMKKLDVITLQHFLDEFKQDGATCKICGKSLVIKDGYRGCYLECTGKGGHRNGLTDI